jgi:hypothetical protein
MSATETGVRLGLVLAGTLLSLSAWADTLLPNTIPEQAAAAQALFVEGRHLVSEGRYAEGCTKLEQSQRLETAAGTQVNLADCYERMGKVASAWITFHEAVTAAQRTGRPSWAEEAQERARALEPIVPRLTVIVDRMVDGLIVRCDGREMDRSTLGSPVPVDPGFYRISVSSPGHVQWSTQVSVGVQEHVLLHVPELPARPLASIATAGEPAVAWLGAGTVLGAVAIVDNDKALSRCPAPPRCTDAQAVLLTSDASRIADASTAAFIAGAALATGALAVFLTSPTKRWRSRFALGTVGGQAVVEGRW